MSDQRAFCPVVRGNGWQCDYAEHPGEVHVTWVNGWPQQWSAMPDKPWVNMPLSQDILDDAPEALRAGAPKRDPFADYLSASTVHRWDPLTSTWFHPSGEWRCPDSSCPANVEEIPGPTEVEYDRLVEGIEVSTNRPIVGLFRPTPVADGHHAVILRGGGRRVIRRGSEKPILVIGHRGGCEGDCSREDLPSGSYPKCWEWDKHVATGIAAQQDQWKDWTL